MMKIMMCDDVLERQHNLLFYKSRKTDLFKVNSFNVSVSIENAFIPPDVKVVSHTVIETWRKGNSCYCIIGYRDKYYGITQVC